MSISHYTEMLRVNPSDSDAYHGRAKSYAASGELVLALADANCALRLSDGYHHYFHYQGSLQHTRRGDLYVAMNELARGMEDYDKAVFLDHKNNAALYAKAALMGEDVPEASEYKTAIELDYDYYKLIKCYEDAQIIGDPQAARYYAQAHLYVQQKHYPAAILDLDKALAITQNASLFHDRGWCHQQLRQYDAAIADYTAAIAINAAHSNAYYGRGTCHLKQTEKEKAFTDYNHALLLSSAQHECYHHQASDQHTSRADIYFKLGDYELALNDYTKALDLNRNNSDAYWGRAESYNIKENYRSSMEDYAAVLALDPQHARVRAAIELTKNKIFIDNIV